MSKLKIFDESANILTELDHNTEIASAFKEVGVRFEQWQAGFEVTAEHNQEEILAAYKDEVDKLVAEQGYQTCDVISLNPNHPDKVTLRAKFLTEHTHSEDEVRFFVKGQGLFSLHIGNKIYSILCQKNDLISVPAGTPHWFDMGSQPEFTCIRLFNNPDGWVANYTNSQIDEKFPQLV